MTRAALVAVLAGASLLAGCTRVAAQPAVPQVTVSGVSDPQTSLAPDEVLAARRAAGIADCPTATQVPAGHPSDGLPSLVLDCMGGDTKVNLAALPTGRPRVVVVWAQWCGPCADEAPHVTEVWRQTKGRVDFIGIDYQDPQVGKAVDFASHYGLGFPELVDPKGTAHAPLRLGAIPQTLFVDAAGHVVGRHAGPFRSAEELRAQLHDLLGVSA